MTDDTLGRLIKQAGCQHTKRMGGNDYIECFDCGLLWDYRRKPDPWLATANAELVKQLAALRTGPLVPTPEEP